MTAAVVYYSMTGNTRLAAQKIAQLLHADLIEITPEKRYPDKGLRKFLWGGKSAVMGEKPPLLPYEFDAGRYDSIVFGFPVWAGRPAPPISTFVRDNLEKLRGMKISAFACQGGSGAQKAFSALAAELGTGAFERQLILIDPKDRPKEDTQQKIREFCDSIW